MTLESINADLISVESDIDFSIESGGPGFQQLNQSERAGEITAQFADVQNNSNQNQSREQ